jgi:CheY-like chemotaxis protein
MSKKDILIVDDEPDVVAYLSAILENYKFGLHTADNAETGLQLAREVHPDLICLDIMMPRESGLSMYNKLRRAPDLKDIPVLIISGVEQANEFNFRKFVKDKKIPPPEHYFEKPIDINNFIDVVKRLVSRKKQYKTRGHPS